MGSSKYLIINSITSFESFSIQKCFLIVEIRRKLGYKNLKIVVRLIKYLQSRIISVTFSVLIQFLLLSS